MFAAMTVAKVTKGAKVIWTVVEITDTTMDAGQLADDLARHFMGVNYDPKAKRLYEEACAAGRKYDETVHKVNAASADIGNLIEGIRVVTVIHLDYGDQQKIIFVQLDKLDKLKQRLSSRTPTAYTWFETVRGIASTSKSDTDNLDPATPSDPWWMYTLRGVGLGIEMRATYDSYNEYKKKKKSPDNDADNVRNPRRRNAQADIFSGIDPEDVKALREVHTSKLKKMRSGLSTLGASLSWGLKKVATAGSFAMNIYTIVNKVKTHELAVHSLNENIERYKNDKVIYEYMLSGVPEDSLFEQVKKFFAGDPKHPIDSANQIDIDSEESKQALRDGFYKQIEACNRTIKGGNNAKGEYVPGILECMNDAYVSLIQQFEKAAAKDEVNDQELIERLKNSKGEFNRYRTTAEDMGKNGDKRKNSLDSIAKEFSGSVSTHLALILSRLNTVLADHSCFSQLLQFADVLLKEEKKIEQEKIGITEKLTKKQEKRVKKAADFAKKTNEDDKEDLEKDIKDLDEEIAELNQQLEAQASKFDAKLDKEAKFALNLFDGPGAMVKDRAKLRDLDQVKEALRQQMEDLKKQPAAK